MTFGLLFKSRSIHRPGAPAWWWGPVLSRKVSVSWVLPRGYFESSIKSQSLLSLSCRCAACTLLLILELGLCKAVSLMLVCSQLGSASSVQSLSCSQLFATLWTAARQASLSITNSQSLLKLMSIELVTPSYHLLLERVWKAGKGERNSLLPFAPFPGLHPRGPGITLTCEAAAYFSLQLFLAPRIRLIALLQKYQCQLASTPAAEVWIQLWGFLG